jgi:hypothetical protein
LKNHKAEDHLIREAERFSGADPATSLCSPKRAQHADPPASVFTFRRLQMFGFVPAQEERS